ncbi:MAG: sugar kinase [Pseudomonadota bacterium]
MQKTLLGIGECMVELSQAKNDLLRKSFAGDVFNSLWYARAALPEDWSVAFHTSLGTDPMSDEMRTFMADAGIDCSTVRRIEGRRPGLYMIHLDGAERSFSYWRDTSAARLLASDETHLRTSIETAQVVYLSGITLAILPPDDVARLIDHIRKARQAGKLVAFDSNIRPALWDNAKRMKDLIAEVAGTSTLVFPSFDDEQAAFGDMTPQDTVTRYADYGAETVVLKNGEADVRSWHAGQSTVTPTPTVTDVKDTTGAGDSFNGAFLSSYITTKDVHAAIKAGQACAGRVIGQHGALIAL